MSDQEDGQVLAALTELADLASGWPLTARHRTGSATGLVNRIGIDWPVIDLLLNDQAIRVPAFRMVEDNELVPMRTITRWDQARTQPGRELADPVKIMGRLGSGATLVLQGVHRRWAPLRQVTRQLSSDLGHAVSVNAFLTPSLARGFGAHHDPQHAWLVQLAGYKHWRLWAPDLDPERDEPDLEASLAPGDVLWIPRGWWHSGHSEQQPSLHLTFTVLATTMADVAQAVLDSEAVRAGLRDELPPNALADDERAVRTTAVAVERLILLLGTLDPLELGESVISDRRDQFDPLPAEPIQMTLSSEPGRSAHTHPEGVIFSRRRTDGLELRTVDASVIVPADRVSACRSLLDRPDSFNYRDLIGAPGDLDQELLTALVQARLICFARCRHTLEQQ